MDTETIDGIEQTAMQDVRQWLHHASADISALLSYCDLERFELGFSWTDGQLFMDIRLACRGSLPAHQLTILRNGKSWHKVSDAELTEQGAHVAVTAPLGDVRAATWQVQLTINGQGGEPLLSAPALLLQPHEFPTQDHFIEGLLPPFNQRAETGVCFSGGGSRSMALSIGQLRGLSQLGLLDKVRYTSSVSGGSWAATVFSYQGTIHDQTALIGPPLAPAELSVDTPVPPALRGNAYLQFLSKLAMNLIGAAAHSIGDHFPLTQASAPLVRTLLQGHSCRTWDRVWIDTVADTFLSPLGLATPGQYERDFFSIDTATAQSIQEANPALADAEIKVLRNTAHYIPYPVINATIGGPVSFKGRYLSGRYVGYEYTPLYAGPSHNGAVSFGDNAADGFNFAGSAVQSFGQNSNPLSLSDRTELVTSCGHSLSLATMTGTSSAAYAGLVTSSMYSWNSILALLGENKAVAGLVQKQFDALKALPESLFAEGFAHLMAFIAEHAPVGDIALGLQPQAMLWNRENRQAAKAMNFLDGGNIENYGIMAMLRRQVKKLVVFINTEQQLKWQASYADLTPDTLDSALPALFGAYSATQLADLQRTEGMDMSHNQVFAREDLEAVVCALRDIRFDAKGAVRPDHGTVLARSRHTVQANHWWQIEGGWDVEVLWVYNAQVPVWQQALSEAVRLKLDAEDKLGDIGSFPTYHTVTSTLLGMSETQLNALANLGAWNVTENQAEFEALLD